MSNLDQYKICEFRGHESNYGMSIGNKYINICKYCNTEYYDETIRQEIKFDEEIEQYLRDEDKNG